jgi:hypothetical protein
LRVGELMRLAKEFVLVYGFVTRYEIRKGPVERRGTNLINGEKVSCHGEFYHLNRAKPNVHGLNLIIANGPAV